MHSQTRSLPAECGYNFLDPQRHANARGSAFNLVWLTNFGFLAGEHGNCVDGIVEYLLEVTKFVNYRKIVTV